MGWLMPVYITLLRHSKLVYSSFKKDEYSKRLGRKFIKKGLLSADIHTFRINKPTTKY